MTDEYSSDEEWSEDVAEFGVNALVKAGLIPRAKAPAATKLLAQDILLHLSLDRPAPDNPPAPAKKTAPAPKKKPYYVSIWTGTAKSQKDLDAYLDIKYKPGGYSIPSTFMKDFGIGHYDDDFREAALADKPTNSLAELLQGYSHAEQVIPAAEKVHGKKLPEPANVALLLYDFNYEQAKTPPKPGKVKLRFLASVAIEYDGPRA
jgi:hypothetical protein